MSFTPDTTSTHIENQHSLTDNQPDQSSNTAEQTDLSFSASKRPPVLIDADLGHITTSLSQQEPSTSSISIMSHEQALVPKPNIIKKTGQKQENLRSNLVLKTLLNHNDFKFSQTDIKKYVEYISYIIGSIGKHESHEQQQNQEDLIELLLEKAATHKTIVASIQKNPKSLVTAICKQKYAIVKRLLDMGVETHQRIWLVKEQGNPTVVGINVGMDERPPKTYPYAHKKTILALALDQHTKAGLEGASGQIITLLLNHAHFKFSPDEPVDEYLKNAAEKNNAPLIELLLTKAKTNANIRALIVKNAESLGIAICKLADNTFDTQASYNIIQQLLDIGVDTSKYLWVVSTHGKNKVVGKADHMVSKAPSAYPNAKKKSILAISLEQQANQSIQALNANVVETLLGHTNFKFTPDEAVDKYLTTAAAANNSQLVALLLKKVEGHQEITDRIKVNPQSLGTAICQALQHPNDKNSDLIIQQLLDSGMDTTLKLWTIIKHGRTLVVGIADDKHHQPPKNYPSAKMKTLFELALDQCTRSGHMK